MKFGLLYEIALPIDEAANGRTEHEVYHEALEQVVFAEEMGFDHVWAVEHHFLEDLSRSSAPEVFLAACAARTTRIRIGHGVVLVPPPFNHPVRVAERIGALDIISNGRVDFGTGRSITTEELGGFEINPEHSREMWDEAVKFIPTLWRDHKFAGYEGRFFSFPPRVVVPKPVQKPHPPLWMACTSPSSFELAGKYGMGCLSFTTGGKKELGGLLNTYREAVAEPAEPISDVVNEQIGTFSVLYCGPDNEEALQRGGPAAVEHMTRITRYFGEIAQHKGYDEYKAAFEEREELAEGGFDQTERARELVSESRLCVGDPQAVTNVVRSLEELGVDEFLGVVQFSDLTHDEVMRTIELMGREVIPQFQTADAAVEA